MAEKKKKKQTLYVAPEPAWRPRKIGCPEEMIELWQEYKASCDNHTTYKTVVSSIGVVQDVEFRVPRTYTIRGFCLYVGLTESSFERTYKNDELFSDVIELMEMETEIDARGKFEDGTINAKLASLWMGRHKGYSEKTETKIKGGVPVIISGEDALED